jgi:hypothetical protein
VLWAVFAHAEFASEILLNKLPLNDFSVPYCLNIYSMLYQCPFPHLDKANDISSGTEWYIVVVSLVSGIIIGILLSYIVLCYRRKLRSTKSQSKTEPQDDKTYQDLDLTKMNTEVEDNYESVTVNIASNDTAKDDDSTHTELNSNKDVENNYQSLS